MKLFDLFDKDEFFSEHVNGYIRNGSHPTLGLDVFCYTEKAVYENRWNDVTRGCRGLIVDSDNVIVAYCMPKFFNASEHLEGRAYAAPLPNEPFKLWPKIDGSLGTVFNWWGKWMVATKGGFGSEQAIWAQAWLDARDLSGLDVRNTYVTEIVYPENRIVVDYHGTRTLTLLTVFGPDGYELRGTEQVMAWSLIDGAATIHPQGDIKLSRVLFYAQRNQTVFGEDIDGTRGEGYVLRYDSGLRVKVKFSDYIKLHGIVTGLTERHVWELLREGRSLESLFEVLPDEYHDWLTNTAVKLSSNFEAQAIRLVQLLLASGLPSNPRNFQAFTDGNPWVADLFNLYDVVSQKTWNSIKPPATGPWKDRE